MKRTGLRTALPWLLLLCACAAEESDGDCKPEPGTICTIAGTGIAGVQGDDGPATAAELYSPMDMTLDAGGALYMLDWNNHRIRGIDASGTIHTIAGVGELGDGPEGPALAAHFNHPTNIAFDKAGRMIVAAWHNSRVVRVDLESGLLEDIAGTGKRAYAGDGGPASTAILDLPASVACDADDNLFIMDQANQTIRRIDADGVIDRFAGRCLIGVCDDGEEPTRCPDTDKWSCIGDSDPDGCKKPCSAAYGGDDGPALEARFAQPVGQSADPAGRITFDADGNLFIADTGNHRIRKIDPDGMITSVVGNGEAGYAGDGGPALLASLDNPVDVAVGSDGVLYIADTYNHCIRSVSPDGIIDTFAGECGRHGFAGDGQAPTHALFNRPYGVALDAHDNLYVADTYNHRIRLISR
jgi:sugar lactone lactonase YvrE